MGIIAALFRMLGRGGPKQTGIPAQPDAPPSPSKSSGGVASPAASTTRKSRTAGEKIEPHDLIEQARSPDKRWSVGLAVVDIAPDGRLKRRIHLQDNETGRLVAAKGLVRSMGVSVSNTGTFVVNDAGEYDSGLHSDLIVYGSDGEELYRRTYEANLFSVGISACGRYVAGQTARSGNADDFLLEAHDVQEKRVLLSRKSATGLNGAFAFETDATGLKKLFVIEKGLGRFAYRPTGEFADAAKYLTARLSKGDYAVRIGAAREVVDAGPSAEEATRALSAIESALAEVPALGGWLASGLRVKGELLEILERKAEAAQAYKAALEQNPKIGVRKKLASLEKQLGRAAGPEKRAE